MKKTLLLSTLLAFCFVLVGCGQKPADTANTAQPAAQQGTATQPAAGAAVDKAKLASCLTEKKWVMYGTERCPHCKSQKELFGADFDKATYVDCDKDAAKCTEAGINGYPTWKSPDGKSYPGSQQLAVLAQNAGCTN
jgi:hypothetical protein